MDIRMICMDLDGTALQKDHQSFSPKLQRVLLEAHERGIVIVPVTGRQYPMLPQPLKDHPAWESLVVLCNGGEVRNLKTGALLQRNVISRDSLEGLLALSRRFGLPVEFSWEGELCLTPESLARQQSDPQLTFHREAILPHHGRLVPSLEPYTRESIEKVNLLCIPEVLRARVEAELKPLEVSAVWSSDRAMEITHAAATKGNALGELSRMLCIPRECIMALGDSGNDVSMLQAAGFGVAMGNGPDWVKAQADAVTQENHHDGAANAIERVLQTTAAKRPYIQKEGTEHGIF